MMLLFPILKMFILGLDGFWEFIDVFFVMYVKNVSLAECGGFCLCGA